MVPVDLWNDQRHERIHAVVPRVGRDEMSGGGVVLFQLSRHRRIERREEKPRRKPLARPLDPESADALGYGGRELPAAANRLFVALPGALVRGHHFGDLEPGMLLE